MIYGTANYGALYGLDSVAGANFPYVPLVGCTLLANKTYLFPLGGDESPFIAATIDVSTHCLFNAALAGTLTLEVSNMPRTANHGITGAMDISDWDTATAGGWLQWNPTLTTSNQAVASGSGNSVTAYTGTIGGSAAGGIIFNIADLAFRRVRLRLATTAAGIFRPNAHAKLGG